MSDNSSSFYNQMKDLLSYSVTLTFNLTTVLLLLSILVWFIFYILRYYILVGHSRLPPQDKVSSTGGKLLLEEDLMRPPLQASMMSHSADSVEKKFLPEEIFAEFLSSIRVFSYLEKHILAEFAKNAQQKRIYAGEILWQYGEEPNRDLHLVMDGCMQIYLADDKKLLGAEQEELEDNHLLVTECKSGGIVSSLFDVLAIYTDEFLSNESDSVVTVSTETGEKKVESEPVSPDSSISNPKGVKIGIASTTTAVTSPVEVSSNNPPPNITLSTSNTTGTNTHIVVDTLQEPTRNTTTSTRIAHTPLLKPHAHGFSTQSCLYARAACETTLLVIPESAFKRVAHYYPSSAISMVQIVLSRYSRVTTNVLHKYLGFTREMLKIQRTLNDDQEENVSPLSFLELQTLKKLSVPKTLARADSYTHLPRDLPMNGSLSLEHLFDASIAEKTMKSINTLAEFIVSAESAKDTNSLLDTGSSREKRPMTATDNIPGRHHQRSTSTNYTEDLSKTTTDSLSLRNELPKYTVSEKELKAKVYELLSKKIGANLSLNFRPATSSSQPSTPKVSTPAMQAKNMYLHLGRKGSISSLVSHSSNTGIQSPGVTAPVQYDFQNDLEIIRVPEDSILIVQGQRAPGLFYVLDGTLEAYVLENQDAPKDLSASFKRKSNNDLLSTMSPKTRRLYLIHAGGLAGYDASLSNHASFVSVKAMTECHLAFFPKSSLDLLVEKSPQVLFNMAKRLVSNISPLVVHLDLALEWIQVNAGKVLYEQAEPKSDSIYIVLNGRLRSIEEDSDKLNVLAEYGHGESVGELEVLTESARLSTVHAIRDTELACMPKTLFHALALRHPEITIHISRLIAIRSKDMRNKIDKSGFFVWKTIALIPENNDVPILEFADRLKDAIGSMEDNSAIVLDSSTITSVLGKYAFSKLGALKLSSWLSEREDKANIVLYVADNGANSPWTQRCIRQADCVLFVALADGDPSNVGEYEKAMLRLKSTARKELVLLHFDHYVKHSATRKWLNPRPWIQLHHHIQVPMLVARTSSNPKTKTPLEELQIHFERLTGFSTFANRYMSKKKASSFSPKHSESRGDFSRLARRLTGRSIGLALGGGGARGIAHIGIIQAFEEAGIPIDIVSGVSIGALVGGLYSLNEDVWFVYWKAKEFASKAGSLWRQLLDLTYPVTSWFSGQEFNRAIWKCFSDSNIEDCWINYCCLTTNISHSRLEIHTMGYIWRYVRASMSLSGFLPPLCENGDLLVDGGYMNNLPGDILRNRGAETVIAIDVSSEEINAPATYGDYLSGWYALLNRFNPFSRSVIPSLADIQSRLAYVSCYTQLEEVKNMDGCIYLRPPVGHFGTIDFGRFDEIYEAGYKYGQQVVKEWESQGKLRKFVQDTPGKSKSRVRRNSF